MKIKLLELKQIIKHIIREERISDNSASYEVKKDKVIATLRGKSSEKYTKLTQEIVRMDQRVKELKSITDPLNKERIELDKELTVKKDILRDKIISEVFDEQEKFLSLAVQGLGAAIAIDKHTEKNDPSTEYREGDVISINYEKAWETLMSMFPDLTAVGEDIIRKVSQIATETKIKPGTRRSLNVKVNEGVFDSVKEFITKITNRIKNRFLKIEGKINIINSILNGKA